MVGRMARLPFTFLPTLVALVVAVSLPTAGEAARITVYGLQSVRFDNLIDPSARPERLQIVSGSLKFTGRNKWEKVTYIPRQTAAPKSDYGIYTTVGNRIYFYSLLTFSTYYGLRDDAAGEIYITKINRQGQSQRETWYIVR